MKVTKTKIILSSVLLLFIFTGCGSMNSIDLLNAVTPSNNYERIQMTYGTHQRQKLDVYIPEIEDIKTPIVFVYGGAWRDGNKQDFKFVAHALTSLGHPVIIPDYRLFPEAKFPDFINDVADAIIYFEQRAVKILPKPMNKFILMGHSSGAHTATLLATDKKYLKSRKIKAKLTGLIAMAGPYDLNLENPEVTPVFKNATRQQSNPILNIHQGMPAVLLLHGLDDDRVFPFHTERFEKALLKAKVKVTTHLYKGVNHTELIGSLAAPLRFLNNSFKDIKDYLKDLD